MDFVGLGGEVFHKIGLTIKTASPWPHTFILTHCNGAAGYLPAESAYSAGGYEVGATAFAPSAAGLVIEEALALLRAL